MGSSAAKFVSEEEKEETSSDVKSLDCWDLSSSEERDQNGMVEVIPTDYVHSIETGLDMHTLRRVLAEGRTLCLDRFCWQFVRGHCAS